MRVSKKLFLIFTSLFIFTSFALFAQEGEEAQATAEPAETAEISESTESAEPRSADFVMQFEPGFYLNTENDLIGAPSPIVYPISLGFLWPDRTMLAIQPTVSFFMMNHLLHEDKAIPAEIENRTTTTLCFMVNIPAVLSYYLENSCFQANAGLGIFMRFGLLSPGVKESDSGWSGSAGEDVEKINEYFWQNMRWLYFSLGGSWLYNLTPQLRAGPTINVYLPVAGLISDKSVQGMLISAGIKICR